jgi:hypothetical protein
MQSKALTVAAYLASVPKERRAVLAAVRSLIRRNLPKGYREVMNWGAITYEVPLRVQPDTYNGKPLAYAGLAAQRNYFALYLIGAYQDPAQARKLAVAFKREGKTLDMGKSCLRFKSLDDLSLAAVGEIIAATPMETFIARNEKGRRRTAGRSGARRAR